MTTDSIAASLDQVKAEVLTYDSRIHELLMGNLGSLTGHTETLNRLADDLVGTRLRLDQATAASAA